MKVLVTGGAGYIGSFMTKALFDLGHAVVVADSLESGYKEAVDYANKASDKYDRINITTELGRPYAYVLFYTGYDPEFSSPGLTPGDDNGKYPKRREIGFGLNIGF